METNKNFKKFKYLVLALLLCPLLLFVGCKENCFNAVYYDDGYGSYNVTYYIDGEEYLTKTSNDNGYVTDWPQTPTRNGYKFYGWYTDPECTYELNGLRTSYDRSLYGKFIKQVAITLIIPETLASEKQTLEYEFDINSTLELIESDDYKVKGYLFNGFYLDAEQTQEISKTTPIEDDCTIYTKHTMQTYTITYENVKEGYTNENPTTYSYADLVDSSITFKSVENTAYFEFFDYWQTSSGSKKSYISSSDYSFGNLTLYAVYKPYNLINPNSTKKYLDFGFYPQTLKEESVNIDETITDSNGYFKGSDGCWYAKQEASLYNNTESTVVENGTIINGEYYYFKVEPIRWQLLSTSSDNTNYYLLSEKIIEYGIFGDTIDVQHGLLTKDESEEIHEFCSILNSSYFSTSGKEHAGIGYFNGNNFQNQTNSGNSIGLRKGTDYAIANGLFVDEEKYGSWWLKSTYAGYGDYVDNLGIAHSYTAYSSYDMSITYKSNYSRYKAGLGYVPYCVLTKNSD